jgi:D-serine deaminase-like pyridoxal phosphate-dependent protein
MCLIQANEPIELFRDIDTPALIVDLDAFKNNVSTAETMAMKHGKWLRPHVKTHRSPGLARRQLGEATIGVTCATVGEAEAMVNAGIDNILLANEFVTPQKLGRIAVLARRAHVSVAIDAREPLDLLAEVTKQNDTLVDVLIDLDVGLGRCGLDDMNEMLVLARAIAQKKSLRLAGLMGYEGRMRASLPDREKRIRDAFARLARAKAVIESAGLPVHIVSAAGTSTFLEALQDPMITEIQVGTYALMEPDLAPLNLPFQFATVVLGTVISRSASRAVLDVGRKTVGTEYGLPISLHSQGEVLSISDEHLVLHWHGDLPPLGTKLQLRPTQLRTTFNLYDRLYLVQAGDLVEVVPVCAKGQSQ